MNEDEIYNERHVEDPLELRAVHEYGERERERERAGKRRKKLKGAWFLEGASEGWLIVTENDDLCLCQRQKNAREGEQLGAPVVERRALRVVTSWQA